MKKIVIGILSFMFMLTGCQSQDKEAPVLTLTKSRVQIALNDTFDYSLYIEKASDSPCGFQLNTGCQVAIGTPRENIDAYIYAARQYGRGAQKGHLCQGLAAM